MWKWIVIFLLIVTVLLCFQSCWWLKPGKKYKCLTREGVDEYGDRYSKRYSQLSKTYKENSQEFDASECYVIRFSDLPEAQKYPLDELACVGEKDLEGIIISEEVIQSIKKEDRNPGILSHIVHNTFNQPDYRKLFQPAPDRIIRKSFYHEYVKDPFLQLIGYDDSTGTSLFIDKEGKKYVDPFGSFCYRLVN